MKKIVVLAALIALAPSVFAGESVGLIVNFKENINNISLDNGISTMNSQAINRSLDSARTYIEFSDPKLSQKFLPLKDAADRLCSTVQMIFNLYLAPLKEEINPIAPEEVMGIVSPTVLQNMEPRVQALRSELKKVKGSIFSGFSLAKKSEAQKLIDGIRDALVKKIEEVLKEFDVIKKTRKIKRSQIKEEIV